MTINSCKRSEGVGSSSGVQAVGHRRGLVG
jgi:hypothetical protein